MLQIDPTRSDAWANLGGISVHLKEWERGYSALEQVCAATLVQILLLSLPRGPHICICRLSGLTVKTGECGAIF